MGSAEFEQALSTRPRARTEHFALHRGDPQAGLANPVPAELSTARPAGVAQGVEDRSRFGQVIPKRHARRAVSRSLIKRQGRAAFDRHAASLPDGDWLLRLRSPFPSAQFPSAASGPLKLAVRRELEVLFQAVAA